MSFLASILNLFDGPQGIVILLVILLLFGAKRIPDLARSMGKAIREFQKAKDEFTDELHKAGPSDTAAKTNTPASTVPRTDAPAGGAKPDPNQSANPGDKTGQV